MNAPAGQPRGVAFLGLIPAAQFRERLLLVQRDVEQGGQSTREVMALAVFVDALGAFPVVPFVLDETTGQVVASEGRLIKGA